LPYHVIMLEEVRVNVFRSLLTLWDDFTCQRERLRARRLRGR